MGRRRYARYIKAKQPFSFRTLKRELENSAKNCRVLQFKLKKTEKTLSDTTSDLSEAETKMKSMSGGGNALETLNKVTT